MTEEVEKYLSDILMAIEKIEMFSEDTANYSLYIKDLKTQSAIERQLVIVGEALNKVQKINPEISILSARQIIGFRNRLVHAYDSIDNNIVWAIIKNHIPKLKIEITSLNNIK